jgi:hypothetical protein
MLAISLVLFAAFTASGQAKMAAGMTQVSSWLGTWNCVAGKDHYTTTYSPLLKGAAMRISNAGTNSTEGIAKFDTAQNKWFYTAVFGNGLYLSMMGTISGNTISFTEVYPTMGATLSVTRLSATRYSDTLNMMVKGKKMSGTEVCTRT